MTKLVSIVILTFALTASGWARSSAVAYERPLGAAADDDSIVVAGFRALFTCSAHFQMNRPLDDIIKVELADTSEFDLPDPVIDEQRLLVRASGPGGTEQVAVYRDTMGCTVLPPHWSPADAARLPYVEYAQPQINRENDLFSGAAANPVATLKPVLDRAFDQSFGDDTLTTAVIVLRDGKVLAERYRDGFGPRTGYRTWSTAKTITAAVIGIAVKQKLLTLNDPIPIPEWADGDDPRAAITLQNLLQMASGLMSEGSNTNAIYFGGQDAISATTSTPLEAEPGERWKYANNDTMLTLRALRHRLDSDLDYLRFPYDHLLRPLGMFDTRMEVDHQGNFIGSSQVYTTARDLARFGVFMANDGMIADERVLPQGWIKFLTTPATMRPVVSGEWGYGAQVWLLDALPGVPKGSYTSAGNKGQFITVVPSSNLVVVRTGVDPKGSRFAQDRLLAEVVAAL